MSGKRGRFTNSEGSFNSAARPAAQGQVNPAGQNGEAISGWKDLTQPVRELRPAMPS